MVHILTDSTADLSPELLNKYGIEFIPLTVILGGKTYRDQADIDLNTLFHGIKAAGELAKTSAPSVAEFSNFFNRPGEQVFISISSQLSATHQNSLLAKEISGQKQVHIIDSLNLSTGCGLLVLRAAELRDQGCTADEIETEIQRLIPKVRTSFVIDTLEYLYKGGRCSAMENIAGSLLKIRPVIEMRADGTLGVKNKIRGSRKKALDGMLEDFRAHLPEIDLHRVFVTHTGCDEDAEYLKQELFKIAPIKEVLITYAGCVVASHCGQNTIGILYMVR